MSAIAIHPAQLDLDSLLESCDLRRQRRSGPGGQHRNKVETGIFIEHRLTGIRAEATEKRSQQQNRDLAIQRLRVRLALEYRTPEPTESPTELWKSRLRTGRIRVNDQHVAFPALLAEALDVLRQQQWETKVAAEQLGCSASQLVKFLKQEPRGLVELNRQRERLGLGKLK